MSSNNEQSETMVRSTQKFTFDDNTVVEPEGDASLDVFSDGTNVLSLPTVKKKINGCKTVLKIYVANTLSTLEKSQ